MPGAVFKNIAESVYMRDLVSTPVTATKDTLYSLIPKIKGGMYKSTETVLSKLNQKYNVTTASGEWIKVIDSADGITLQINDVKKGLTPDVTGMGARDAIYLLENSGLKVNITGAGRVVEQSIPHGSRIVRGSLITIRLE